MEANASRLQVVESSVPPCDTESVGLQTLRLVIIIDNSQDTPHTLCWSFTLLLAHKQPDDFEPSKQSIYTA